MRGSHFNTVKANTLSVKDRLFNNKTLNHVINYSLQILMCFIVIFSVGFSLQPQNVKAETTGYMLDKTVTWADGTTERVQIDNEGFFILDGLKRRLVGVDLTTCELPYGEDGQFYLPENLALYDKELDYLQSIGIRVIHTSLVYIRWYSGMGTTAAEDNAYSAFLDLIYEHKMLVIPGIYGKWMTNCDSFSIPDFSWELWCDNKFVENDSMGAWATRWGGIVGRYPNVVTVVAENEIDCPLTAEDCPWRTEFEDQDYGTTEVTNYLTFMENTLKSKVNVPVITKLVGVMDQLDIKKAALAISDIPSYDIYKTSSLALSSRIDELTSWMSRSGIPFTSIWCMELNSGWPECNVNNFTADYLREAFEHGASLANLWPANWSTTNVPFFTNSGDPIDALKEIAKEIPQLQEPIGGIIPVSIPAPPPTPTPTPTPTPAPEVSLIDAPTLTSPVNGAKISTLTPVLKWNRIKTATSYAVQISTSNTFDTTVLNNSKLTKYTYTVPSGILTWDKTYYWRVNVTDKEGNTSGWSDAFTFLTAASPVPAAPSNLTAANVSRNSIKLTWTDNSSNESGFTVERKIGNGVFTRIANVRANTTSYTDKRLRTNTTYTYRITAYNSKGTSATSNEITVVAK